MIADLVYETTATAGTGSFVYGGAKSPDFRTFLGAHQVGDVVYYCCRGGGQWETGKGTVGASSLDRTEVYNGSGGIGVKVNFAAGDKELYETIVAGAMVDITGLQASSTLADNDKLLLLKADGSLQTILGSIIKASGTGGGTGGGADTTGPTFPDSLSSSNVTQTAFRLSWAAATDANGIQRYEYSFDGTTWTTAGTALFVDITGRTAGTSYTMRVRAVDPSGNYSTVRQLVVVTQAAVGNQAPAMSGSITVSGITSSGYAFAWSAGTDDVGVDHYETSIDGGTTWTSAGTALTRTVTGRPASTTDNLRVRAHDVAGLTSNVLSATATTLAAAAGPTMADTYTVTNGYTPVPTTATFSGGAAPNQYWSAAFSVYVKDAGGAYPAAAAIQFCWSKDPVNSPLTWTGSAWTPIGVPYTANGGSSGTVPNSVKASKYVNSASFPGLFQPDTSLFGGGTAGNYYLHMHYSDGSHEVYATPIAVS